MRGGGAARQGAVNRRKHLKQPPSGDLSVTMAAILETLWRWFFRTVIAVGVLFTLFFVFLHFVMTSPLVTQSEGYVENTPDTGSITLSGTLPDSATKIRFCRVSVGMGGRLLVYRFSGRIDELKSHAEAEFAAHWDKPQVEATPNSASPFTQHDIEFTESGFGVKVPWMLPPADAVGTVYASSDGQTSHRPTIFVDASHGVLYFWMTD
jgi:hypothetical protein